VRLGVICVVAVVVVAVAGGAYYQHRKNTLFEIDVGGHSLSVQKN